MNALSINNTSAASLYIGTSRIEHDSPHSASLRSGSTSPSITDSVTLSKKATLGQGGSINCPALGSPVVFDSYIDAIEQQRRAQAMRLQTVSISVVEKSSTEQTTLLNNFQTVAVQFRQSVYAKVFNLNGDIFQNRFDIFV